MNSTILIPWLITSVHLVIDILVIRSTDYIILCAHLQSFLTYLKVIFIMYSNRFDPTLLEEAIFLKRSVVLLYLK